MAKSFRCVYLPSTASKILINACPILLLTERERDEQLYLCTTQSCSSEQSITSSEMVDGVSQTWRTWYCMEVGWHSWDRIGYLHCFSLIGGILCFVWIPAYKRSKNEWSMISIFESNHEMEWIFYFCTLINYFLSYVMVINFVDYKVVAFYEIGI